jgi:hypothetical protein
MINTIMLRKVHHAFISLAVLIIMMIHMLKWTHVTQGLWHGQRQALLVTNRTCRRSWKTDMDHSKVVISSHIELTTTMRATTITMIHSEDGSHTVTTYSAVVLLCSTVFLSVLGVVHPKASYIRFIGAILSYSHIFL